MKLYSLVNKQGCWEKVGGVAASPPLPFAGREKWAKLPFKYNEYYITVSFQGAFS